MTKEEIERMSRSMKAVGARPDDITDTWIGLDKIVYRFNILVKLKSGEMIMFSIPRDPKEDTEDSYKSCIFEKMETK